MGTIVVRANWDGEASVWVAESTDLPGLLTEADTLQWLAGNSIGLNAYQLQPGFLIRSYSNMAGPTTMNAKTWSCQSSQETEPGQGAGSAVMAWFQAQNS